MYKLSIIVPVYYNELNLPPLYEAFQKKILCRTDADIEVIFVDDGSGDNSYEEMCKIRQKDSRFKILRLSRNFGSHTAILAGFAYASGDCVTMVAADLQEPLEMVWEMYDKWRQGHKVVIAVRKDRKDSFSTKFFAGMYYKLMRRFAIPNMPEGGFDCFLLDKQVKDIMTSMSEKNSSIVGQVLWMGFNPATIEYVRREREIGTSKWTLKKKMKLFTDSFMAFSYVPIQFISSLGMLLSLAGFVFSVLLVINRLVFQVPVEGWTTLMITVLLLSGVQMLTLAIIGGYLWRNFDETRRRPTYIVAESLGLEPSKSEKEEAFEKLLQQYREENWK